MLVTEGALWCACQWEDLAVLLPFFPIGQAWALACQWAPGILDLATSSLRELWEMPVTKYMEPSCPEPRNLWDVSVETSIHWPVGSWAGVQSHSLGEWRNWLQLAGSSGNPVLWTQVTVSALCYFWTGLQLVSLRWQSNTRKGVCLGQFQVTLRRVTLLIRQLKCFNNKSTY